MSDYGIYYDAQGREQYDGEWANMQRDAALERAMRAQKKYGALSATGHATLAALAASRNLCVATLRNGEGREWGAWISHKQGYGDDHRRTIPTPVFRTLVKRGLIASESSSTVSTSEFGPPLIHTDYRITEVGRAIAESEG